MKYLFINSVYGVRSTGKIVAGQCRDLQKQGHTCVAAYGRESTCDPSVKQLRIGSKKDAVIHAVMARIWDRQGFGSKKATEKFLKRVEEYGPDVIWLHNLHGYYIHVGVLFQWLKKHPEIQVYWTLHDCWAFTGHCAYFTMAGCQRWKNGCGQCPQLKTYPKTVGRDYSKENFRRKKMVFRGVKKLTLITPSQWLADLTRESFLSEYPVRVIHNTIDRKIFCPTPGIFREIHHIKKHYMVLGVAVGWEETKGFPDMLKLREKLDPQYVLVLVGTTQKQIRHLPPGIIGISRTENQKELAEIYTAADVFVNPTHQDNFPTVNLEAAACGTPVITYNVGGSPESVPPENRIPENDIDGLTKRIRQICEGETERMGKQDEQRRMDRKN